MKKLQKDLAKVGSFETSDRVSIHICHNYISKNVSSSAYAILYFKGKMLFDTTIKVLIKYSHVLSVFLTDGPITKRLSVDLSL